MIHEYRTYTITPGRLNEYLELAETRVLPIRSDRYGLLIGFWTSEFGTLHQVHHIWQYDSLDQRQELRRQLSTNSDWVARFLNGAWPTMQTQEVRFMLPQAEVAAGLTGHVFYERRIYRCPAGRFVEACDAVRERPRHAQSALFGLWTSESPQPNEICEVIAYRVFEHRMEDSTTAPAQAGWFKRHGGLFQHVDSTLLLPIGISPAK